MSTGLSSSDPARMRRDGTIAGSCSAGAAACASPVRPFLWLSDALLQTARDVLGAYVVKGMEAMIWK